MQQHIDQSSTFLGAYLSALIGTLFDVPAPVLFWAFAGSLFAIGMLNTMTYRRAILVATAGTLFGAVLAPLAAKLFGGDWPLRPTAAIVSFIGIYFGRDLLDAGKRYISQLGANS